MLSGTGIRDAIDGGYIDPATLGLSIELLMALADWVARYEAAHFTGFVPETIELLDVQGAELARRLAAEVPANTVGYFSNGLMRRLS